MARFMKKLCTLLLGVVCHAAIAQTNITTPTVSGTWTLAGSPYMVQTSITVPATGTLTIQPGVVVKMYATTKIEVNGQLIANGTSNNPIIFQANDTTGWSIDSMTTGGWNGLHFHQYGGVGTDQSMVNYCTVQDVKYGYSSALNYMNAFTAERGIQVHNSIFKHNTSGSGMFRAGAVFNAQTFLTTDTLDIYKCAFTDNNGSPSVISVTNAPNGYARIRSSHIYQNPNGSGIGVNLGNILIEDNELDHNTTVYNSCPIMIVGYNAIVRRNKVHHNTCENYGGISCQYGMVTVEDNLICNNIQTNAFCGFVEGGGGMNVVCNGSSIDEGFYIIRNNIIANNHAALGGGGIYVYHARTCISNNHIINNYTPNSGSGIMINGPGSEVYMRSNLFHTQSSPGNVDTEKAVYIYNGSSVWFDYNYMPSAYYQAVQTGFSYTLYGDTLHNVIGTSPALVAPTLDNNYLTDATTADFNLMSTSPCINEGDTVGAFPAMVDYAGNNRFNGVIDIGAYEYNDVHHAGIENLPNQVFMKVYPNPATSDAGFTVITPGGEGRLLIYDLSGKVVYTKQVVSTQNLINLGPEAKGTYLIQFDGTTHAATKVFIK